MLQILLRVLNFSPNVVQGSAESPYGGVSEFVGEGRAALASKAGAMRGANAAQQQLISLLVADVIFGEDGFGRPIPRNGPGLRAERIDEGLPTSPSPGGCGVPRGNTTSISGHVAFCRASPLSRYRDSLGRQPLRVAAEGKGPRAGWPW